MDLISEINSISRLKGHFKLRSGKFSDTYFDKYRFESNPDLLEHIAKEMIKLVPPDTEVLAGLEMGGIPIVTMISYLTKIPAAFIRKEAKQYGTCKYAEGSELHNKNVLIIEDVVSSGGAIIDAVKKMRNDGIHPKKVLCVIDRETGGKENLLQENLELISLLSWSDLEK